MQFYALGKDEFEDRLILSGPVKFKNLKIESSAIKSADQKQGDAHAAGMFDYLIDLRIYEPQIQTQNPSKFVYKSEFLNFIKKEAQTINQRF